MNELSLQIADMRTELLEAEQRLAEAESSAALHLLCLICGKTDACNRGTASGHASTTPRLNKDGQHQRLFS
jgi:hypothetical protein